MILQPHPTLTYDSIIRSMPVLNARYLREVSGRGLGLQESLGLFNVLREAQEQIERVLELGSGFSTYVLHAFRLASQHERTAPLVVQTFERDPIWGKKTERFVAGELGAIDPIGWGTLTDADIRAADLVLLDSGPTGEHRRQDFARLMDEGPPQKLIVDDWADYFPWMGPMGTPLGRAVFLQNTR